MSRRGGEALELFSPPSGCPTVAVLVPACPERDASRGTVEQVRRALADARVPREIVVVNDGAEGETSGQARAASGRSARVFASPVVED